VRDIYRIIKKDDIQVLRTHQYHANLYGRIAGIFSGVPVMVPSFHNLYRSPDKPKIHRRISNYILGFFSDALGAVSNTVAQDVLRYDKVRPEKVRIIYNGIEIERFANNKISKQEARNMLNLPSEDILIGSVGRLTDQKGHRYLVESAPKIGNVCIVIAGDGPLREELKRYVSHLKINCIFLGSLSYEKIPIFLRALDIFCFPSLWEGMPSALIEAMADGLPVVVSDIPPHREIVDDTGIFIPPGDVKALAKVLNKLIKDNSLRCTMGNKARERAKTFSIENTVKTYESLFENILINKGLYEAV
jgi:glycosyltransferase involved in cell wall biosynthesis